MGFTFFISAALLLADRAAAVSLHVRTPAITPYDGLPQYWGQMASCAVDNPGSRLIKNVDIFSMADNSPQHCVAFCDQNGYLYAGVEYGQECHCGRDINAVVSTPSSDCDMTCTGEPTLTCGGHARIQLFARDRSAYITELPAGWETVKTCAVDSVSNRALCNAHVFSADAANSPKSCANLCASKGYAFAGVEYGKECICGTGLRGDVDSAATEECSFKCPGTGVDARATCGAGDRIQVYKLSEAKSICDGACAATGKTVTGSLPASGETYDIINVKTGWRWDVSWWSATPGAQIIAQTKNDPAQQSDLNQVWNLKQVDADGKSGVYFIHAIDPASFANVWDGGLVGDSTEMPLNITEYAAGKYTISVLYSSKSLASQDSATQQVLEKTTDYSDSQLWQIVLRQSSQSSAPLPEGK